jgi:Flp pilus assembly protein TadB
MSRRLQWGGRPETPVKNPYRDTFVVYGLLALLVVVIAWLTGGSVGRAIVVALFFFVVASGWSVYRLRERNRRVAEADRQDGGT